MADRDTEQTDIISVQGRRLKFFSEGAGFELLSELNWNFLCRFYFNQLISIIRKNGGAYAI